MKWNGTGRGIKALAVSLALGLGMTACSRDYTLAYLYVTSARAGLINAYAVDFQSGSLQALADSPIPASGQTNPNPVTLVASPNGKYLYVVNHDTSEVVEFAIGTDGKIYSQNSYGVVKGANGVVGSSPTAAAIDSAGKFLYVTFTFQSGFTTARPGPGGVAIFPIATDGSLGAALVNTTLGTTAANPLPYVPVGNNPSGIVASPRGGNVYVIDQERPSAGSPFGVLLTFTEGTDGSLTPIPGPISNGLAVGTAPSGIAEDPSNSYLYVTDQATNQLYGFAAIGGGSLRAMSSSPFNTGLFPLGVTVDPRGSFVYVANFGSSTVGVYAIGSGGALSGGANTAGGGTQVATGPTCVTIEPALGIYLYTSNNTDNSVSGEQLNPHTGALIQVQGTQFSAQALPTCAVAVANGAHPTQLVPNS